MGKTENAPRLKQFRICFSSKLLNKTPVISSQRVNGEMTRWRYVIDHYAPMYTLVEWEAFCQRYADFRTYLGEKSFLDSTVDQLMYELTRQYVAAVPEYTFLLRLIMLDIAEYVFVYGDSVQSVLKRFGIIVLAKETANGLHK